MGSSLRGLDGSQDGRERHECRRGPPAVARDGREGCPGYRARRIAPPGGIGTVSQVGQTLPAPSKRCQGLGKVRRCERRRAALLFASFRAEEVQHARHQERRRGDPRPLEGPRDRLRLRIAHRRDGAPVGGAGGAEALCLRGALGVLHGSGALRAALQERTPMTVLSPDTLTFGEVPELDPGPEWPSLLVDFAGPARDSVVSVKWAKEARTAGELVNELRRALYFAEAVPKGPTLVSVPFDLLMSPVPCEERPVIAPRPVVASAEQLDEVAALLAGSAEPIIVTEHGGRTPAASAAR